jgi:hypothetical protein
MMKFKSIDWNSAPALREGHAMIVSGENLRSVAVDELDDLYEDDPDLCVLADSPEAWKAYVRDRVREIAEWALRNCITLKDREFLKAVGVAWIVTSPTVATPPGPCAGARRQRIAASHSRGKRRQDRFR